MALTRRSFLKTTAALSASVSMPSFAETTAPAGREPLTELAYADAQLTGGPLAAHYDAVHAHFLSLSNDRLLKVYRQRAGLTAPGADMGGWYDTDGFVPGHALGQYISGLSRISASTGDAAARDKAQALVAGFGETLGPKNESILRPQTNLWVCYTLDKHFCGLIDAATLTDDNSAKGLLTRVFDGAQGLLPAKGRDRIGKKNPPYDETFVMPENLFAGASLTGDPRLRDYAQRYLLDREMFAPLARGEDPFPGQHAYSHVMALSSAGRAYAELGDTMYRDAMQRAFTLLTSTQAYASGGYGPNETLITPHRGELFAALSTTQDHFETPCGSYAATKLSRYLLRSARPTSTAHADYLERVLFNTILASLPPDSDGGYFYYSTYSPGAVKVYYQKKWPCCSGTLVQTVADYPLNLGFTSDDGYYVTLYTPSRVRFNARGANVTLEQTTEFPTTDHVAIALTADRSAEYTLYLRLPAWLARPASLKINGRSVALNASTGSFAAIKRTWHSGDVIELEVPQDFRMEAVDEQHPDTVALMRGPVQYVAIEGAKQAQPGRRVLPASLKPSGADTFTETVAGISTVYVPLHRIVNQTYTAYFTKA
ncbi:hypothetical protein SAMN05421819_3328 [Bryocella elongata]|uniref:Tat (Twin-arginine translocation) pathway signal sequence n=1 Tax=Bryocella elongata TaxID=863522 RepID=A0A1H6AWH4_9BACT|nr:beta-L-arabinofuranosidase domain-containing protein [Bryocella elongata]SEG52969.1 hypothetical protein SAMN05421819_3328 [Bryocella elongata]